MRRWRAVLVMAGIGCAVTLTPLNAVAQSATDTAALGRLRQLILLDAPEVAARRSAVEAARARARAAGAAAPATVNFDAEEVPGGKFTDAQSAGISLSWDLFTFGRRPLRRAVGEREVDEALVQLGLAERRIVARTTQLLMRLVGSMAIRSRLAAEDSLLAAAAEALQARFATGDARYIDVLRLRTERLRVQSDAASAATDVSSNRRGLLALAAATHEPALGALVDSVVALAPTDPGGQRLPAAPELDSLVATSAPALLGAAAVERAAAARQLAGAERRLHVSTSLGVQRFAVEGGGFDVGPSIAVSLALPFTSPAGAGGQLDAATRDMEGARMLREAEVRRTRAELGAARDRYEAARRRLAVFEAALLQGAREEREAALAAYRSGELSLLELIDFERALSRTEITRWQTVMEAADALAVLQGGAP